MARVKISEYTAKTILTLELGLSWQGLSTTTSTDKKSIAAFFGEKKLVIKVDQGVKKRGKQGLVKVNIIAEDCMKFTQEKAKLGYSQFLIEEFISHKPEEEHYLSLERVREGMRVLYSEKGGIEVEENWNNVKEIIVARSEDDPTLPTASLGASERERERQETKQMEMKSSHPSSSVFLVSLHDFIENIIKIMDEHHFSFLEINPLVIQAGAKPAFLDCAVLIDDAGLTTLSVVHSPLSGHNPYGSTDVVVVASEHSAEKRVRELDATTPASLKLKIINPDGNIWMLLSGGGASLVLADEVADLGYGKELANYGEYSGSPSTEDTYLYARTIINAMLDSKAEKKVLIIAGGVANFTDVAKTFKGIILALSEVTGKMQKQGIKVYVRKGGPNQDRGLALMKDFLEKNKILGFVAGPEMVLTEIVKKAIRNLAVSFPTSIVGNLGIPGFPPARE